MPVLRRTHRPAAVADSRGTSLRGTDSAAGEPPIPPQSQVEGGPETPLELGGTGWRHVLRRAFKEFGADRCTTTAGSLAYHWFLALFPAVIALLGLTSVLRLGGDAVTRLINGVDKALPRALLLSSARPSSQRPPARPAPRSRPWSSAS